MSDESRDVQAKLLAEKEATYSQYVPRMESIEVLLQDLDQTETLNQLAGVFQRYPREFGFDTSSIIVLNEGRRRFMTQRVLTSLPEQHVVAMLQPGFVTKHPIISTLMQDNDVCFYPAESAIKDLKIKTVARDGTLPIASGVAFRIDYSSGFAVAVFLNSSKPNPWNVHQFNLLKDDIRTVAMQFADALIYFSAVGTLAEVEFTADELRFLRIVATNNDPDAARDFQYGYGSAYNIQTSIIRKLGISSIFQAVAIAVKRGLIDLETIDNAEITMASAKPRGWSINRQ